MQKQIAAGDIVQLKSGGPAMTVLSSDGENVEVEWVEKETFPVQCVSAVSSSVIDQM